MLRVVNGHVCLLLCDSMTFRIDAIASSDQEGEDKTSAVGPPSRRVQVIHVESQLHWPCRVKLKTVILCLVTIHYSSDYDDIKLSYDTNIVYKVSPWCFDIVYIYL
jgi:hypothetical protein